MLGTSRRARRLAAPPSSDDGSRQRPRGWAARDPLRRRILALADVCTVGAVAATLALFGPGPRPPRRAPLPARLHPRRQALWALRPRPPYAPPPHGRRAALMLSGRSCPSAASRSSCSCPRSSLDAATAIRALVAALAAALALPRLARFAWRRVTPPERVVDRRPRRARTLDPAQAGALLRHPRHRRRGVPVAHARPLRNGRAAARVDRLILAVDIDRRAPDRRARGGVPPEPCEAERRPARARHLRHGGAAPPRRRPAGGRVQHLGRLALDAAAQARARRRDRRAPCSCSRRRSSSRSSAAKRLGGQGSVFYVQTRAGLGGREFRMFKFRTMRADAEALLPALVRFDELDEPCSSSTRDPRVTRLGRVPAAHEPRRAARSSSTCSRAR